MVLGEHRSTHDLRVRVAYDYLETWVDDFTWTPSPATVGAPFQVRLRLSRQKSAAIKVRIEDIQQGAENHRESIKLTGVSLEYGVKRGLYKRLPAAQSK